MSEADACPECGHEIDRFPGPLTRAVNAYGQWLTRTALRLFGVRDYDGAAFCDAPADGESTEWSEGVCGCRAPAHGS